jgi:manganese transport protein
MKITRRIQSDSLRKGFKVAIQLGFGKPDKVIPEIVNKGILTFWLWELMVIRIQRFNFGTTVDKLRHKISIPLFIVKN